MAASTDFGADERCNGRTGRMHGRAADMQELKSNASCDDD